MTGSASFKLSHYRMTTRKPRGRQPVQVAMEHGDRLRGTRTDREKPDMSTETSLNEWLNPQAAEIRRNKESQSGLAVLKKMMSGAPKQKARIDRSEAELRAATADLERMAKGLKPKGREAQIEALGTAAAKDGSAAPASEGPRPRMTREEATRQYLASFAQTPDPAAAARKPNEPVISDPARPHTESMRGIPVGRSGAKSHWLKPIPDSILDELRRITGQDNSPEHKNLKVLVPTEREETPWYPQHDVRIESVTIDTDPDRLTARGARSRSAWIDPEEAPIPTSRVIGENERDEVRVLIAGGPESNNQNAIWRTLENVLDRSRATGLHLIVAAGAKPIFSDQSKQADGGAGRGKETPVAYAGQGPGYLASRWVHYKGPDADVSFEKHRNNWDLYLQAPDGERKASSREVREDRNLRMLDQGKPHLVILFPQDGEDPTTQHLAESATLRGVPVEIGDDNGRTYPSNNFRSDEYTPPAREDDDLIGRENPEPNRTQETDGPEPTPATTLSDMMSAAPVPRHETSPVITAPESGNRARSPESDRPEPAAPDTLGEMMSAAPAPRNETAPVRGKGRPTGGGTPVRTADAPARETGGRS